MPIERATLLGLFRSIYTTHHAIYYKHFCADLLQQPGTPHTHTYTQITTDTLWYVMSMQARETKTDMTATRERYRAANAKRRNYMYTE